MERPPFDLPSFPPHARQTSRETSINSVVSVDSVDSLPSVPEFYPPLQNVLVLREQDTPANIVCQRISDFMRLNSIYCVGKNLESDGRLVCSTTKVPKFVVQLWARPAAITDTTQQSSEIIVEVQRRQGCSVMLHRIRKSLARSIRDGDQHMVAAPPRNNATIGRSVPDQIVREASSETCQATRLEIDLCGCIRLLESVFHDQKRLGMESLSILTDPSKVGGDEALIAATSLIFREGPHGDRLQNAFEDYLYFLLQEQQEPQNKGILLRYALLVGTNAMDLLVEHGNKCEEMSLADAFDHKPTTSMLATFWRNVIDILVRTLEDVEMCPQNAALSIRCLRILETHAPNDWKPLAQYDSLSSLVQLAHEHGKHVDGSSLEEESLLLLDLLLS